MLPGEGHVSRSQTRRYVLIDVGGKSFRLPLHLDFKK